MLSKIFGALGLEGSSKKHDLKSKLVDLIVESGSYTLNPLLNKIKNLDNDLKGLSNIVVDFAKESGKSVADIKEELNTIVSNAKELHLAEEVLEKLSEKISSIEEEDIRYDNETIGKILSTEQTKNSRVKFGEIQFDSENLQHDLKSCFQLAKLKPLCLIGQMVSQSPIGAGVEHWVFYYFLDGDNLLYFDPLGETNALLAEEMLYMPDKNVFISNTKIQQAQNDAVSCGPICVEALKYLAQEDLLKNLQRLKQGNITHLDLYKYLPTNLQLASKGNIEDFNINKVRVEQLKNISYETVPDLTVQTIVQDCRGKTLERYISENPEMLETFLEQTFSSTLEGATAGNLTSRQR